MNRMEVRDAGLMDAAGVKSGSKGRWADGCSRSEIFIQSRLETGKWGRGIRIWSGWYLILFVLLMSSLNICILTALLLFGKLY
jgi:hypothetical protein